MFDLVPRCFSAAYELVSGRLLLVQQYAAWRTWLLLPLPCTAVAVGFTVCATVCRYPVHGCVDLADFLVPGLTGKLVESFHKSIFALFHL
jgi:hypothetical protein